MNETVADLEKVTAKLIEPDASLLNEFRDLCEESWNAVHDRYLLKDPQDFDHWRRTLLAEYEDAARGIGLQSGWVPSATLWILAGTRLAGIANFRLRLTPELKRYGGTFGFVVRPSMRRRGCLRSVFPALLETAWNYGENTILLTCEEENAPCLNFLLSTRHSRCERDVVPLRGAMRRIRRFFYERQDVVAAVAKGNGLP